MSTRSQHEQLPGTLKMPRGEFEESIKALERPMRDIYQSPRDIFDRLRTDDLFAQRIARSMAAGGYGTETGDHLLAYLNPELSTDYRHCWESWRTTLHALGFRGIFELGSNHEIVDLHRPVVGKKIPVSLYRSTDSIRFIEMLHWMKAKELRPLTAVELLSLAANAPRLSLERNIVAMGSEYRTRDGLRFYIALSKSFERSQYWPCLRIESVEQDILPNTLFAATSAHIK